MHRSVIRLQAVFLFLLAAPTAAQTRGLEVLYGSWLPDSGATVLSAAYVRQLIGPVGYGIGVLHLNNRFGAVNARETGGEVSLAVGRDGAGFYGLGSAGLVMRHTNGEFAAQWSAGAGYALRAFGFLSLGLEARYRVEDSNVSGFWSLAPDDRKGLMVQARVAFGFGSSGDISAAPSPAPTAAGPEYSAPTEDELVRAAAGASDDVVRARTSVAQTALDAMGTPYEWGGSDTNGFDCSGLIQYAYSQHGVLLPRISRDQARMGVRLERDVSQLRPGDILGFTIEGSGVSHVGLYVGDGMFIHSAPDGVKLSSLRAEAPESSWWRARWTSASRILN